MTASKNSFHSTANEILNDSKILEGRLPTQNQMSKPRIVLGQKPEYNIEKSASKRNSIDAELLKIQKESKNDFRLNEKNNNINNNNIMNKTLSNKNETKTNFEFKQDILTKQAIDEKKII